MLRRLALGALGLRNEFCSTLPAATNAVTAHRGNHRGNGLALILLASLALTSPFMALPAHARAPAPAATHVAPLNVSELPPEGRTTYGLIRSGGPFPFEKDGVVFGNREKLLPQFQRGHYREYTVATPKARNRGARRIVCGGAPRNPERCYYTADHYSSFREIVE